VSTRPTLQRALSLPLITLYGLGTTIGAGIYALIGAVAGQAGLHAPVSFAIAALLAGFTAFSFAELASRHPRSAGEALYVREGLRRPRLASAVGLLVVLAGGVSAATIANGFAGYCAGLIPAPRTLSITALLLVLGLLAAWGVRQSVLAASVLTVIEIAGLVLVIWAAREGFAELPSRLPELVPPGRLAAWQGVLGASLLAFYAFIGFEDMVNVAEEVRNARRVLPLAIVLTLALTTLLYVLVATVAVLVVPPSELAASGAPLALLYQRSTASSPLLINLVSVVAMVNGAMIQIIMASRVLYGLATQGALPASLGRIHPRTRTPLVATALVTLGVVALALWLPLAPLAELASVLTLVIFTLVNLALCCIKRRHPRPQGVVVFPGWVPAGGFLVSLGFVLFELGQRLVR
jgi:amino acid transporter